MKNKKFYLILFTIILSIIILFSFTNYSNAGYPKVVKKIIEAFEKIEEYIVALSTPAAAVAVGAGFLMQKFSFGDEERIRIGKKLIRISIIAYVFILLLDLLIDGIKTIVK